MNIKPDIIKFDRDLITDIHKDESKKRFVSGLIQSAKRTNSIVLAEGVEDVGEVLTLKELGVTLFQGFLLHRPSTYQSIDEILELEKSTDLSA